MTCMEQDLVVPFGMECGLYRDRVDCYCGLNCPVAASFHYITVEGPFHVYRNEASPASVNDILHSHLFFFFFILPQSLTSE